MPNPGWLAEFIRSHLHNLLVHFPVGLITAGALFVWWPRDTAHEHVARILWGFAAVFSLMAAYTGENQILNLRPGVSKHLLDLHRALGTWTTFLVWGGFFSLWLRNRTKLKAAIAGFLTLLVLTTLLLGTRVAHA